LWKRSRSTPTATLQEFINLVLATDISAFTEAQFVTAEEILNDVIDGTEKYLTADAHPQDYGLFAEGIRQLRDARFWIKQGLSPDPTKRPSEDERRRRAEAHAATAWVDLLS